MYEGNNLVAKQSACGSLMDSRIDRTVGENIDQKIAGYKAEIARLEASKATLGPLLHMKIEDLRNAMQY